MSGRSLAYLARVGVERVPGLAGKRGKDLVKAGIESVADLLLHAPYRYVDRSNTVSLAEVPLGEEVTVIGRVERVKLRRVRRNMAIVDAVVYDGASYVEAVWFNQEFRAKQLSEGAEVALSGKIERFRGKLQMKVPEVDVLDRPGEKLVTGRVVPIHRKSGSVRVGDVRRAIRNALDIASPVHEVLPDEMLARLELCGRAQAFTDVHFPETTAAAEQARHRLVFDEFFRIEIALALQKRRQIDETIGVAHDRDGPLVGEFVAALPYALTSAQQRVIAEIGADLARPHPMHRLLQGEVGSGKTVVAVAALLTAIQSGYQGAVMAPTEVLAGQHYMAIRELVEAAGMAPPEREEPGSLFADDGGDTGVPVALLTSAQAEVNFRPPGATSRDELLAWIANGDVSLVVGTHALIQEGVHFSGLGVAVVDEQHRFGVHQRVELREKAAGWQPHLLIMTATPIPRTLSMTMYGDLDVSSLDELPPGRTPVTTLHTTKSPEHLESVYALIRREVAAGRQAFVVCPLVEDSDKIYAKSATAEHKRLQSVFSDARVGLIHGQLPSREKEAVMASFRSADIDVLVATTVIEVGIDVPNATVMVIEDADRFGLSQLHQLRGRVGRGKHHSTCVLVAEPTTPDGEQRIAAMVATTDGFRLAEEDLRIRGQGTIFGARQAGMADLRLGDILRDYPVLVDARREAFAMVAADPGLAEHPEVADEVRALLGEDVEWLFLS